MCPCSPGRRRRFSGRRVFQAAALVTLALVAGWFAVSVHRAGLQRDAVAAIRRSGGWVFYNCRYTESGELAYSMVPGPKWLQRLLGADFLGTVDGVLLTDESELEGLLTLEFPARPKVELSDADLAHLEPLEDLDWLALRGMPITGAGLAHLEGLTDLQRLWLDGTQVTDAGLKHLRHLENLTSLWLDDTRVTDGGLAELRGLTRLEWLSLVHTAVSDRGLVQLDRMRRLRTLRLRGTKCTFSGVVHLFVELQGRPLRDAFQAVAHPALDDGGSVLAVDLTDLQTTDSDLTHLVGLRRIEWLFLRGTRVTDAGLAHLEHLKTLTLLDLTKTQITDAGLKHLAGLPRLRTLHLGGTRVTDQGVQSLKRTLPQSVRIYRVSFRDDR